MRFWARYLKSREWWLSNSGVKEMGLGYMGTTLSIFQLGFIMMMAQKGITTRTFLKQCLFAKNMRGLCLIRRDPSKLFETVKVVLLKPMLKPILKEPLIVVQEWQTKKLLRGIDFTLIIHSVITLSWYKVDLQVVLGTLGVMWESTRNGKWNTSGINLGLF